MGHFAVVVGQLIQKLQKLGVSPTDTAANRPAAAHRPVPVEMQQPDLSPLEIAGRVLAPVASPLATTGIVFIVAIFVLLQQTDLRDRLVRLSGLQDLHRTTRALDDAARRLSRYLLTQLGLNAFCGLIIGIGLLLIGVPNPLLWGTLAALLRFVPYIGSVLAALLPTALAAAVDPGWSMAIECAALFAVTELVMGQFIDPMAYGRSTGLAPVSVVIAAIFWTWMWGPIGLVLSTPLTVCLVVLGRHIQRLEFLDVLMGNRPALTPAESFYQRLLAKDADAVMEQAEALLKDRSLSTYYDEVAITGLRLATNDIERGALDDVLLTRVLGDMNRLIEELGRFDDALPASAKPRAQVTSGLDTEEPGMEPSEAESGRIDPAEDELPDLWSGATPVMCISGSGLFDQPVTDMLVQLLAKNGLGASMVPFAAASWDAIGRLDVSGVATVCLCCLDISASPSQLRYLVRRIRQTAPRIPILVGFWSEEEDEESHISGDRLKTAVDADQYVGSLRVAVNTCLTLASAPPASTAGPDMAIPLADRAKSRPEPARQIAVNDGVAREFRQLGVVHHPSELGGRAGP